MHSQQRGPPFLCHQHPAAAKGLGWRVGGEVGVGEGNAGGVGGEREWQEKKKLS